MKTTIKNSWQGIAALIYSVAVVAVYRLMPSAFWNHNQTFTDAFWTFGFWPPILVLALWGLWCGNVVSRVCAILAIV
jgi:hypothetical protein